MPESNSMAPKSLADPDEASTPEDVATLYSWANMHGAKYRDFSASRAQAREEARLRVEEAAAAERRRQEEEAERKAQEEAQLAARLAAEAAEAARQAEADRLAEIARQAEAERQAVLAAQEAQRQAVQQRGWQAPPEEAYQGGYATPIVGNSLNPALLEFPILSEASMGMGQQIAQPPVERLADFGIETSTPYGVEFGTGTGQGMNLPSSSNRQPAPYRSSYPEPNVQGGRLVADQNWQRPHAEYPDRSYPDRVYPGHSGRSQPVSAQPGLGLHSSPLYPASAQAAINPYPEDDAAPFAALPSYVAPHESYMQSPWQPREEREIREPRELTPRPAWLAPELPVSAAPVSAPPPQPAMSPYSGQPSSPAQVQKYVPMYAQTWSQPMMQDPAQNSGQNLNQGQNSAQDQNPVDGTLVGSRDRLINRWFALKSVFDPQAAPAEQVPAPPPARVPVLAVFSLAGGVGKTSLVASLGRALSSRGERVLLVDTAAYGLLPFFFGARDQRPGLLRTFNPPGIGAEAPIQLVSLDPEGQSQEGQGQDSSPERGQEWLAQEVARLSGASHRILVDLPTASGATTRRALRMAPVVLVPVVPDMNSVVSVGAIESFFRHNGNIGGKQIMPYYVLNQFDYSLPLHLDVREILREQIGDRLLPFALRRSPAVSEALAEGMTVMDYAPGAQVAEDYAHLAQWVRSLSAPAIQSSQNYGSVRWSER